MSHFKLITEKSEIMSKKCGTPLNFLVGQIFPAVSAQMGEAYISPHDVSVSQLTCEIIKLV